MELDCDYLSIMELEWNVVIWALIAHVMWNMHGIIQKYERHGVSKWLFVELVGAYCPGISPWLLLCLSTIGKCVGAVHGVAEALRHTASQPALGGVEGWHQTRDKR